MRQRNARLVTPSIAAGTALAFGMGVGAGAIANALPPSAPLEHGSALVATERPSELLVIDPRVPHIELLAGAARRGVELLLLDAERDGIAQIEAALRGRDMAAIHLVAHGRPGAILLGSTILDARTVEARRESLAGWFARRAPYESAPELLVYACDAAAGPVGASLLRALADATRSEVAGSIDRTGGRARGADWILEARTARIESTLPFARTAAMAYPATLETFQVTSTAASGDGSLAAAVASANANANPAVTDVIVFGSLSGTIVPGATLAISEPVSVEGPGAATLAIDGGGAARIFDATAALTISGLTLANGSSSDGGGGAIRVDGALLSVAECTFSGNATTANGGAIAAYDASVSISEATFEDNEAASGGALFVSLSSLDVEASSFEENTATGDGGGIEIEASTAFIDDSLVATNESAGAGGGIHAGHVVGGPPLVSIQNSTISGNSAAGGGGIAASGNAYVELVQATVTANTMTAGPSEDCVAAGVDGCGLTGAGIVIVESSVLAGNAAGTSAALDLAGDALDLELEVRSSLIGALEGGVATSGVPIFGEDPLLGPLADNGGATRTHALLAGSPAIDGGENPGALAFDQRGPGFPRTIGAGPDMGAYEWSPDDGTGGGGGNQDAGDPDASIGDGGIKSGGGDDGCGCSVPGAGSDPEGGRGGFVAAFLGLAALFRRRRSRQ